MIDEPARAKSLRLLWRLTGRKPRLDRFLTGFLSYRRYLPEWDAQDLIPQFLESEIKIRQCPMGAWSTPLVDLMVLLKAAVGFQSKRILELGSYRGDTARLLAENTAADTVICAVDSDDQHGASYRGLEVAKKIRRKTGVISSKLFDQEEKFDLIFVDADHDYDSVMSHSEVAFQALSEQGVILWHDYHNENYFHGLCGVPEALNQVAKSHALCAVRGTWLAMCSNFPGWETGKQPSAKRETRSGSVWQQEGLRG